MSRVLIVDDEPRIASFVSRALTAAGLASDQAADGRSALRMAGTGIYDLILLDLRLPDIDGTEVLASLSGSPTPPPVMIVSARPGTEERVRCLQLGASDFVTKPFAVAELVARVEARLRDRRAHHGAAATQSMLRRVGRLTIDARSRTVDAGSGPTHLSEREFRLLDYLAERADATVTRQELLCDVWGYWFDPGSNLVEVIVVRLRRKFGADLIETVRNVGYRLNAK